MSRRPDVYRAVIDRLVDDCRSGQGQVEARWVREGWWPPRDDAVDVGGLLQRLDAADRDAVARVLSESFVSGVHQALVHLHEAGVEPFEDGYEGTPFHDFVGRLNDWEWPTER